MDGVVRVVALPGFPSRSATAPVLCVCSTTGGGEARRGARVYEVGGAGCCGLLPSAIPFSIFLLLIFRVSKISGHKCRTAQYPQENDLGDPIINSVRLFSHVYSMIYADFVP